MDAVALFAIPFFMSVAAHEASHAPYRHAGARYDAPYAYAVPPGYGWAPGTVIGAGFGGIAGGAGGAVAGAVLGGTLGYAATMPPYAYAPAQADYAPPARASLAWTAGPRSPSADSFISGWQSFMQPASR